MSKGFIAGMVRRVLCVIVGAALFAGCGSVNKAAAGLTGYSRVCVAGVSYLQFPSGASVEYTPAGRVKTCETSDN